MSIFKDLVESYQIESPIEEEFYRVISKCLSEEVELRNQYEIKSGKYTFRVDFVALIGNLKIGFECDGKAYHDYKKDQWRDGLIVDGGHLHSLIRLRGTDINFRLIDALRAISVWHPELFNERGMDIIEQLASRTAKEALIGADAAYFSYRPIEPTNNDELDSDDVIEDPTGDGFGELIVTRRFLGLGKAIPK